MLKLLFFFHIIIDAIADDTVRYQYVKKKGYVRLHTNKGDLNLELNCDKVMTCIFTHTKQITKQLGRYNVKFHCNIGKNPSRDLFHMFPQLNRR